MREHRMSRRPSTRSRLAAVASGSLLLPAAFAVHQLRYMLAFGGSAGAVLQRTGHSYLHSVVPWIIAMLAVTAGLFLRALGRAMAGRMSVPRYTLSFGAMWLACTGALIAIFCCQEFLEGLLAAGHPAGLVGIFGYGGWWAIPAAACVGLVLAAWFHCTRWVLRAIAGHRDRARKVWERAVAPRLTHPFLAPAVRAPLLCGWSDRGPPA